MEVDTGDVTTKPTACMKDDTITPHSKAPTIESSALGNISPQHNASMLDRSMSCAQENLPRISVCSETTRTASDESQRKFCAQKKERVLALSSTVEACKNDSSENTKPKASDQTEEKSMWTEEDNSKTMVRLHWFSCVFTHASHQSVNACSTFWGRTQEGSVDVFCTSDLRVYSLLVPESDTFFHTCSANRSRPRHAGVSFFIFACIRSCFNVFLGGTNLMLQHLSSTHSSFQLKNHDRTVS